MASKEQNALKFVEWAHVLFTGNPLAGNTYHAQVNNKLRELGLLSEPEPTDAEKLAVAEQRIRDLEGQAARQATWHEQLVVDVMRYADKPKPPRKRLPEDVNNWDVRAYLRHHKACPEAIDWMFRHGGNLAELWRDCNNAQWMMWWMEQCGYRLLPGNWSPHDVRDYYPTAPIPEELQ